MDNFKKLESNIEIDKEILDTLPKKTEKNKAEYRNKLNEINEKYENLKKSVIEEIRKRNSKILSRKFEINDVHTNEIKSLADNLDLLNKYNTAFEKTKLDRKIHDLTYFYNSYMEQINNAILGCIKTYSEMNIEFNINDYKSNKYVYEYISALMNNKENGDKKDSTIKSKFEEMYWKFPAIISYIELVLLDTYSKNMKKCEQFVSNKSKEILQDTNYDEIKKKYDMLREEDEQNDIGDPYKIIKGFLNGTYVVKDYDKDGIYSIINKYTCQDTMQMNDEEFEKTIEILKKMYNSLYEYKNYNQYKSIIDDIIDIYKNKDKYKNEKENLAKQIQKNTKEIKALGSRWKINKKSSVLKQEQLVNDTMKIYSDYFDAVVYDIIANDATENLTYLDILRIVASYYTYMFHIASKKYQDSTREEIDEKIDKFVRFTKWPNFTILNNTSILDEKSMIYLIKDRYQLSKISLKDEYFEEGNLDNVLNEIQKCIRYYYIKKNNINLEDIDYLMKFEKILKK